MTITKYGHCCLLIEIDGKRILTDPGVFSEGHTDLTDLDLILITHEHGDHCHVESISAILERNPKATIVTNKSVGALLDKKGITYTVLEGDAQETCAGVQLHAQDGKHEEIIDSYGLVQNTGYAIADTFFYPGDSYIVPAQKPRVLALPVAGPWCKVADAIRYALTVAPETAIAVHDAVLNGAGKAVTYPHFERELGEHAITFVSLDHATSQTF